MNASGVHEFESSLKYSHAAEDLPIWETAYKQFFPDFAGMVSHRSDGWWQRAGVDRSVILHSSQQYRIDEKVRGRNRKTGKVYADIFLEFWSDKENRIKGWVCKPLLADYIAYAILPIGTCYLLPVKQLQESWERRGDKWIGKYKAIAVKNTRWTTVGCPVPYTEIWSAISETYTATFNPIDVYDDEIR